MKRDSCFADHRPCARKGGQAADLAGDDFGRRGPIDARLGLVDLGGVGHALGRLWRGGERGQGGKCLDDRLGPDGGQAVVQLSGGLFVANWGGFAQQDRPGIEPCLHLHDAHARLGIAAENSGKLVSTVRNEAKKIAASNGNGTILVDGPPGIGCPVIAALTGATAVLVVTEPTVSGAHDMERVLELAAHFQIPAAVCVNRWDLYPEGAERIEARARDQGAIIAGRIRYDAAVTQAQVEGRAVVELGGPAADDIRVVWDRVQEWMEGETLPRKELLI